MSVLGKRLTLTHSQSNEIVIEVADLSPSKEKIAVRVLHVDDDPSFVEITKLMLLDLDSKNFLKMQEITKLMLLDLDSSFEIDHACCVDEAQETSRWQL